MAGEKIIFSMEGVTKTFPPQKQVLKNIWLSFFYGAKIGVLGLNGSGKSTLLKLIAGLDQNYQGKIQFDGTYKIGYLAQEPVLDETKTVREIVEEAVQSLINMLREYEDINLKLSEPLDGDEMMKLIDKQGELMDKLESNNAWELDHRLETAMEALRCPEGNVPIKVLSGGERRRVALCRLLLSNPDILLLDEPTNHLDAESVHWLEQFLQNFPGTVIAVTHDRYFLDRTVDFLVALNQRLQEDIGYTIRMEVGIQTWRRHQSCVPARVLSAPAAATVPNPWAARCDGTDTDRSQEPAGDPADPPACQGAQRGPAHE
jgi:ATPase subunit of ABC transporter with duplicated ATPase domains